MSKERPIIFSAPMIRAILAGRKTQTRRILETQMYAQQYHPFTGDFDENGHPEACWQDSGCMTNVVCPYGVVGDRLWVRETFIKGYDCDCGDLITYDADGNDLPEKVWYAATNRDLTWAGEDGETLDNVPWKPSIHMFRSDSRITLEITEIRVERVQDISEADAIAEGARLWSQTFALETDHRMNQWCRYSAIVNEQKGLPRPATATTLGAYAYLWDTINAKKPGNDWQSNPWVWCLTFKRIEQENQDNAVQP